MSSLGKDQKLVLPDRMKGKLESFQKKVWIVKITEGILAAFFGLIVSFLAIFVLDRFFDTPSILRISILVAGCVGLGIWFPLVCHKWVWKSRKLEQVARLLRFRFPRLSDHLLGIIELVNNPDHRGQSEQLCHAALRQVDEETKDKDFSTAVPYPRHKRWILATAIPAVLVLASALLVPAASQNAFARWLAPWLDIQRYTFAQVQEIPNKIVVPEVEESTLKVTLKEESPWKPETGMASIGESSSEENRDGKGFVFPIPPQQNSGKLQISVGDFYKTVEVDPKPRPELNSIQALVELPKYLEREDPILKDARGGSIEVVKGATFSIKAASTRDLQTATVNDKAVTVQGNTLKTEQMELQNSQKLRFHWTDHLGLRPKKPLVLNARLAGDESPMIQVSQQPGKRRTYNGKRYVLENDILVFDVHCEDDFGVKTIGMEWSGVVAENTTGRIASGDGKKQNGDLIIAAGNPEASQMDVKATFSPARLGMKSAQLELKLYAIDYLPGRERVYAQTIPIFVLSQQEHAILLTRKLDKWFKQSLDTYEREQQLFQENIRLRNLTPKELDSPKNRKRIEAQAAAERSQATRLKQLTKIGDQLAAEAARNDQFNVATLNKLAEMLQSLKGISNNRMPSVSDLLKKAAQAQAGKPSDSASSASKGKLSVSNNKGKPQGGKGGKSKSSKTPSIGMTESSMDQKKADAKKDDENKSGEKKSGGKFGLPGVTLKDNSDKKESGSCPAKKQMEQAVDAQEELLAEFQKVAEELQKILNNLEGSTFVKRLKALSRHQLAMAQDINGTAVSNFGNDKDDISSAAKSRYQLLSKREKGFEKTINHIQEDLEAYSNRVNDGKYKGVLKELKGEDVEKQIDNLSKLINENDSGSSIAHSEYLADTFDRWAEQLVGPG